MITDLVDLPKVAFMDADLNRRKFDASVPVGALLFAAGMVLLTIYSPVSRAASNEDTWAQTVSHVANSVVSLQLSQLRDFDDADQGGSTATGFIVDAELGIVLTNRHVVSSGPIRLSATFQNQERVDAVPLYRDPIHDFAFLRYDPAELKYATPESLSLRPDKVSTGMNIRVIGSDGGEQLSILPGTIARVDREVPSYGRYGYNDFNTFYLQAASGTSGGSSGSPVIDLEGDVVALNAAANTRTASSFFLPLPRIQHALRKLQDSLPIDRGGLQTLFLHRPFRELTRLGLDAQVEAKARDENDANNGMLQVSQVIPGGVADGVFEAGDILVAINKSLITNFIALESLLDQSIGETLEVELIRQSEKISVQVGVADLHSLAPRRFLELGDAVIQNMSIQHARAMNRPQEGVVIMYPGYFFTSAGIPSRSVIVEVNSQPVVNLDEFISALQDAPRDRKVQVRYIVPGNEFTTKIGQIEIDNRWFGHRQCDRVDDARFWDCAAIELPKNIASTTDSVLDVPHFKDAILNKVAPAMVRVDFHIPYGADNVYARHFKGVGLVVDKHSGLVAVDRNTVPVGLGDVDITFFGSQVLNAEVVFLHPRHNIALLKYDPAYLGNADFEVLRLVNADTPMPEELTMVGYRANGTFRRHEIDELSRLTIGFKPPGMPRFQQSPLDVYGVPNVPPSLGGPLVDENGDVHAFYMSFAYEVDRKIKQREYALPSAVILESLRMYHSDNPYYSLDTRLVYKPISEARQLGLPLEWLKRYNTLDANLRKVLYVDQVIPATDAADKLLSGDVLIAIDSELVADLFTAELLSQKSEVLLTVLRDSEVIEVSMKPSEMNSLGTQRVVSWSGALFQEPHADIGFQKGVDFPGVYIADTQDGSPALWDGLYRNRFVEAVDGIPIENLDDFISLVSVKAQDEVTRLSVVSMTGRKQIITVEPEYNFWPTFEIKRSVDGWQRVSYLN
ncbi:MAG: trypsin-like peptidase domain-containing protein [Granulosicoccus sp.]